MRDPVKRKKSNNAWVARNRQQQRDANNLCYANNRERILKRERFLRGQDIKKYLLKGARIRARKSGLLFDITANDFEVPFMCPLLGYMLLLSAGKIAPNSPSLDRKDPKKGYVRGNVWVISHRANAAKNDLTLEEIQMLAANLTRHLT